MSDANDPWDVLLVGGHAATMEAGGARYGALKDAAIACRDGVIAWIGHESDLPDDAVAKEVLSLDGSWVTPGLIDCHTHLVYAGHRADEFEQRLHGATYEEISRAGGGIRSTVDAVRALDEEALADESEPRMWALMEEGVTTVEIKSGYGLTLESECRMLRAARLLGERNGVRVLTTFLGAHAVPAEFDGNADGYVAHVIDTMLPAVAKEGLADAVDAFCEGIGFSPDQVRRLFEAARAANLPVKLHAEQLSDLKGARLAAEFGALSADHLEYLDAADVSALKAAGTTAVLLPGAFHVLQETQKPPIEALRAAGVPMAVATDCNPGSAPVTSPLLMMNFACTLFGLTPEESLAGFTRCAAQALGLQERLGTLTVGKRADLAVWDVDTPAELAYHVGFRPLRGLLIDGQVQGGAVLPPNLDDES